jgi:hypothetical protein
VRSIYLITCETIRINVQLFSFYFKNAGIVTMSLIDDPNNFILEELLVW